MYLWPCNVPAWDVWTELQTQWRTGVAGATGLDYAAVRALLDELGYVPGDERRHLFDCIRAAESEVLSAMAQRRQREAERAALQR